MTDAMRLFVLRRYENKRFGNFTDVEWRKVLISTNVRKSRFLIFQQNKWYNGERGEIRHNKSEHY